MIENFFINFIFIDFGILFYARFDMRVNRNENEEVLLERKLIEIR